MKYRYLSYPMSEGMPVYGGHAALGIQAARSIKQGDTANVFSFFLQTHWGTHIDTPRHFFDEGRCINDYSADNWVFKAPVVLDVALKPGEVLKLGDWVGKIKPSADILILKSGWGKFRINDKYIHQNPGLHPEVGFYLRKNFKKLRAVGIDWISISSAFDKPLGRRAHQAFLDPKGKGRPLLIVEDMCLVGNLAKIKNIVLAPLFVVGVDSAPCTVLGEFHD